MKSRRGVQLKKRDLCLRRKYVLVIKILVIRTVLIKIYVLVIKILVIRTVLITAMTLYTNSS